MLYNGNLYNSEDKEVTIWVNLSNYVLSKRNEKQRLLQKKWGSSCPNAQQPIGQNYERRRPKRGEAEVCGKQGAYSQGSEDRRQEEQVSNSSFGR